MTIPPYFKKEARRKRQVPLPDYETSTPDYDAYGQVEPDYETNGTPTPDYETYTTPPPPPDYYYEASDLNYDAPDYDDLNGASLSPPPGVYF